jgi:hypothetical protein
LQQAVNHSHASSGTIPGQLLDSHGGKPGRFAATITPSDSSY